MNEHQDWLDDELAAVARDDAKVGVPAHVGAAVLRAWDARASQSSRSGRTWRIVAWMGPLAVAAAVLLIIAVSEPRLNRQPALAVTSEPVPAAADRTEPAPETRVAELPKPARAIAPLRVRRLAEEPQGEYVIVPDPFAEMTPMSVVRVRMSRTAFATLGVPIASPDSEGLVEVEMLVGDDGVARTIRRATFVDSIDGGIAR